MTTATRGGPSFTARLGAFTPAVDAALAGLAARDVVRRIWAHDHTLWGPDPAGIADRLGWLHCPDTMPPHLPAVEALVEAVRADGFTRALLLGMGGSSLAPEVLRATFGARAGFLDLAVLDSTDPVAVRAAGERHPPATTLYIVATKSGGTVETLSFFQHFHAAAVAAVGAGAAGRHFVAITDPGSGLAALAARHGFRATFLNDPTIGGRFSALSLFGLVPAALGGVDARRLLAGGRAAAIGAGSDLAQPGPGGGDRASDAHPGAGVMADPGVRLGTTLGALARVGRDKLTLVASAPLAGLGAWVEQLVAESTGKAGTGILPVVGEDLGPPEAYGDDRLFVQVRLGGDTAPAARLDALAAAGHPVVRLDLADAYDLGGAFFQWEMATAVAGHLLGINPFDQPDVEAAKVLAREMVADYRRDGRLPTPPHDLDVGGVRVFGAARGTGGGGSAVVEPDAGLGDQADLATALAAFVARSRPGDYIAVQAFLPPTAAVAMALETLRTRLRDRTRLAVTVGFGPRFLHSTGQLHKGDRGNGLFVQLTHTPADDVPLPDDTGATAAAETPPAAMTFGVLELAQALGDGEALRAAGRRVVRFDFGTDVEGGLARLLAAV